MNASRSPSMTADMSLVSQPAAARQRVHRLRQAYLNKGSLQINDEGLVAGFPTVGAWHVPAMIRPPPASHVHPRNTHLSLCPLPACTDGTLHNRQHAWSNAKTNVDASCSKAK